MLMTRIIIGLFVFNKTFNIVRLGRVNLQNETTSIKNNSSKQIL